MPRYDAKQVCLNGHHITDRVKTGSYAKDYCDNCGSETITECPKCDGMIKGENLNSNVATIGFEPSIPSHCEHCGEPFPAITTFDISRGMYQYTVWPQPT